MIVFIWYIIIIEMIIVDENAVPEYIIDFIKDNLKNEEIDDDDDYDDKLRETINDWVVGSTGEATQLTKDFGILKAIRLYQENYGEFELNDDDYQIYLKLSYCIIYEWFSNYYDYEKLLKEKKQILCIFEDLK